jgi:hypothetical protein
MTYSTFGNNNLAGSIYNTGNRYITELSFDNTVGAGRFSLTGWNLYRTRGALADGTVMDHENLSNAVMTYAMPIGSGTIEPNVEGRLWSQVGVATSYLGTFGLRAVFNVGGLGVVPSAGYSVGQIGASTSSATPGTSLTGFRGTLAIRLR